MSRFAHLAKLKVDEQKLLDLHVPELGPKAVLKLAHAGEPNAAYFNARFGPGLAKVKAAIKRGKVAEALGDELDAAARRDLDRKLYPKHIIKGWEHVPDTDGNDVPFSVEAAQDLCDALCEQAPDVFDRIRGSAADIDSFRDDPGIDLEEVAKN